jgi:hypothetical protein
MPGYSKKIGLASMEWVCLPGMAGKAVQIVKKRKKLRELL